MMNLEESLKVLDESGILVEFLGFGPSKWYKLWQWVNETLKNDRGLN